MRLESTELAVLFLPLSFIAYARRAQERIHVVACSHLFFVGFLHVSQTSIHFTSFATTVRNTMQLNGIEGASTS
jgi:hypothetical protein